MFSYYGCFPAMKISRIDFLNLNTYVFAKEEPFLVYFEWT